MFYAGNDTERHFIRPAENMSGHAGTVTLPTTNITADGGEWGLIPPGALYYGHDAADQNICKFRYTRSPMPTLTVVGL